MGDRLYDKRFDCYFRLENDLIDRTDLDCIEKMVYIVLCRFANNNEDAFPSYKKIAQCARISRRSAIRSVSVLIEKKLLEKKIRKKKGTKTNDSNVYYILSAKLEVVTQVHRGGDTGAPGVVTQVHPKKNNIKKKNEKNSKKTHENFERREYTEEEFEQWYINKFEEE